MNIKSNLKLLSTFSFSSLTDIVLLLLIFFLLSSSFIIQPGIKVKLPESTISEVHSEKTITITVSKDGAVYLDDKLVNLSTLPALLRQKLISGKNQVVTIKGDENIRLHNLIEIMDIAKHAGAQKFNIATERKDDVR